MNQDNLREWMMVMPPDSGTISTRYLQGKVDVLEDCLGFVGKDLGETYNRKHKLSSLCIESSLLDRLLLLWRLSLTTTTTTAPTFRLSIGFFSKQDSPLL